MEPADQPFPPVRSCALDPVTWSTCLLGFQFALDLSAGSRKFDRGYDSSATAGENPSTFPNLGGQTCGREEINKPNLETQLRGYEAPSSTRNWAS